MLEKLLMLVDGAGSSTDAGTNPNTNSWLIWVILGAFLVIMILGTIIPQRKRQKQAQQMMDTIKIGTEVKTIGGFVGFVTALDDAKNVLTLNIGTADSPTYVVIDRAGIYSVAPAATDNSDNAVAVDAQDAPVDGKKEDPFN